jgi:hypothetical protein
MFKIRKYIEDFSNDIKNIKIFENINYDDEFMNMISSKRIGGHYNNYKHFLGQFKGIEDTIKLMIEYEKNNSFEYDLVIKMRHDIINLVPIQLPDIIKLNTIYVLPYDRQNGYSDKFYFGDRSSMCKLCFFIENLKQNMSDHDFLSGEYFLKKSIELNNLSVEEFYNLVCLVRDYGDEFPPSERGWYSNQIIGGITIDNLIKTEI